MGAALRANSRRERYGSTPCVLHPCILTPGTHSTQAVGVGSLTCPEGSVYEGKLERWQKAGEGVWQHPDGSSYQGQYEANKRHGKARTLTLP